jgi:hypothetical protein
MKSKMLATIMMHPAVTNLPSASAQAAAKLMSTPTNVSTLGWIRSATQAWMMSLQREEADAPDETGKRHKAAAAAPEPSGAKRRRGTL